MAQVSGVPSSVNMVALRKESVDRNTMLRKSVAVMPVALRKESVDRNSISRNGPPGRLVALRKESVDRNTDTISDYLRANRSLSARRAWIEMPTL